MNDTIVAISTCVSRSAINIIRLSGKDSIKVVNKIFSKDLTKLLSNTITYGFIVDKKEKIDEVLVSIFKSPKTYTTEDMIEINCHGSIATTNKILELCLTSGARLAEPGEFIKRAYLNGRIDLVEAESVSDLINSKTENARKLNMNGLTGKLSELVNDLRKDLLSLIANIEVNIDYPEYEDAVIVTKELLQKSIKKIDEKITKIIEESKNGKIIQNGIKVAIIGKPNVGKSSLLNLLSGEEKAIVTEIEGTTRDIVENTILLNGIELKLIDTAGIRNSKNIVETIGIEKSKKVLNESDLILAIFDNSKELSTEDKDILKLIDENKTIFLINKEDLSKKLSYKNTKIKNPIYISIKNNIGIETLKERIIDIFNIGKIENSDYNYLSNSRQLSLISKCKSIIIDIKKSINKNIDIDLIEIDIKLLYELLGKITGQTYDANLLDEIFSKFCLGK